MNYSVLPRSRYSEWDVFAKNNPNGSIYHSSRWLGCLEKTYGYIPLVLASENDKGEITGGIVASVVDSALFGRHLSSLPGAQQCPPLWSGDQDGAWIAEQIQQQVQLTKSQYCEIKMDRAGIGRDNLTLPGANLDYCTYILALDRPFDILTKKFHQSCVRRAVAHAKKNGITIRTATTAGDVEVFYRLYARMRKEKGLLPQPLSFFINLWEIFRRDGSVEINHAEFEGRVISSIMLLKSNATVIYEYGATIAAKKRLNPSPLLLWDAIEKACAQGYSFFDFGRCSSDDAGLNEFKLRWGSERRQLYYYSLPESSKIQLRKSNLLKSFMGFVIKFSPLSLTQLYGRLLYKQLA
jgi:hypothetical protein